MGRIKIPYVERDGILYPVLTINLLFSIYDSPSLYFFSSLLKACRYFLFAL